MKNGIKIEVYDWVEFSLCSVLKPEFGQVVGIAGDAITIENFHGSKSVDISQVIDKIDVVAMFTNDPHGVPPFVANRLNKQQQL